MNYEKWTGKKLESEFIMCAIGQFCGSVLGIIFKY